MAELKYKRVLLKLSGEALAGELKTGINPDTVAAICTEIGGLLDLGVQLALVIGGGNIFRGLSGSAKGMERSSADYMGMLATVLNALAVQDMLEKQGYPTRVLSAITMQEVCEPFIRRRALRHLEKGRVVICAAGTGNPYFTTDTTAALRGMELQCDAVIKATKVDGIYDKDVANEPTFRAISKNFFIYLEDCDLGGYNITKFDIPMLTREFSRAGLTFTTANRRIIDAYNIFCRMEPRNLSAAYKFFCGKDMKDAHSAEADTLATVEIFEGEIKRYSQMAREDYPEDIEKWPETLDEFHTFCNQRMIDSIDPDGRFKWKNGEAVVAFGKNAGTSLRRIAIDNPDFLRWILRSDFSVEVKNIASDALKGIFPEKV